MDSLPMRSYGGRRKQYYHVQVSDISVSIIPDDPECPPGPYKCYVEVGVDNVRKRTRVSARGQYAWNEAFEFSVREDWPICIHLIAKRAFCKDVLLASSGDYMQLPTSTQTKVVSQILRHVHVQGRHGDPSIYQASVTLKLQLIDPHPITDPSSSVHAEESFIEDVGELIAAPNLSSTELGAFSGKMLRHPGIGIGCHSFSDGSSFVVSLHTCEDDSLYSINSPNTDHDEVLVSPVSDLPQGDCFPLSPQEMDDAEQNSVLDATLTDHTPTGNADGGELSGGTDQSLPANTVDSMPNDTGPRTKHKLSMKSLSFRSNRSATLSGAQDCHPLWRRVKAFLFCWRTPQDESQPRTHQTYALHSSCK